MRSGPDGAGGSLPPPLLVPRFLALSRDRRYYGRRRKLFRQARPDFCDIEPTRKCLLSPWRASAKGSEPRVGITPRENAGKCTTAHPQDTLGRTRNFADRCHDSPSARSEFPEVVQIQRSRLITSEITLPSGFNRDFKRSAYPHVSKEKSLYFHGVPRFNPSFAASFDRF